MDAGPESDPVELTEYLCDARVDDDQLTMCLREFYLQLFMCVSCTPQIRELQQSIWLLTIAWAMDMAVYWFKGLQIS